MEAGARAEEAGEETRLNVGSLALRAAFDPSFCQLYCRSSLFHQILRRAVGSDIIHAPLLVGVSAVGHIGSTASGCLCSRAFWWLLYSGPTRGKG
jgi:hypothetical protein